MARKVTSRHVWVSTAAAWLFGFLIFLPILWMFLASFKSELDAFAMPPKFLFFHWTTENYATVQQRSDYVHHALNSIIIAGGSTLIAMLIAVPAAWSMAFSPTKRTKDVLLWMLSTKMMPPVGVLVPIYLIYRDFGLLDTRAGLVFIVEDRVSEIDGHCGRPWLCPHSTYSVPLCQRDNHPFCSIRACPWTDSD